MSKMLEEAWEFYERKAAERRGMPMPWTRRDVEEMIAAEHLIELRVAFAGRLSFAEDVGKLSLCEDVGAVSLSRGTA